MRCHWRWSLLCSASCGTVWQQLLISGLFITPPPRLPGSPAAATGELRGPWERGSVLLGARMFGVRGCPPAAFSSLHFLEAENILVMPPFSLVGRKEMGMRPKTSLKTSLSLPGTITPYICGSDFVVCPFPAPLLSSLLCPPHPTLPTVPGYPWTQDLPASASHALSGRTGLPTTRAFHSAANFSQAWVPRSSTARPGDLRDCDNSGGRCATLHSASGPGLQITRLLYLGAVAALSTTINTVAALTADAQAAWDSSDRVRRRPLRPGGVCSCEAPDLGEPGCWGLEEEELASRPLPSPVGLPGSVTAVPAHNGAAALLEPRARSSARSCPAPSSAIVSSRWHPVRAPPPARAPLRPLPCPGPCSCCWTCAGGWWGVEVPACSPHPKGGCWSLRSLRWRCNRVTSSGCQGAPLTDGDFKAQRNTTSPQRAELCLNPQISGR